MQRYDWCTVWLPVYCCLLSLLNCGLKNLIHVNATLFGIVRVGLNHIRRDENGGVGLDSRSKGRVSARQLASGNILFTRSIISLPSGFCLFDRFVYQLYPKVTAFTLNRSSLLGLG